MLTCSLFLSAQLVNCSSESSEKTNIPFNNVKNDTAKLSSIMRHLNEEYYEYPVIEYMDNLLKKSNPSASIESKFNYFSIFVVSKIHLLF